MPTLVKAAGSLIVGVGLFGVGLTDLVFRQKLGIPLDLALTVAGAGALGVHVNLSAQ
jgi:hypothetical protein